MALNIEYTEEGLKNLSYIAVELQLKKETQHRRTIKGLFLGVKRLQEKKGAVVLTDDPFIWIQCGNVVHMLNYTKYFISSVITNKTDITSTIPYKPENQVLAMERLRLMMKVMKAEKRTHYNGLIDTAKYTGIPEKMLEEMSEDTPISRGSIIPASTGKGQSTPLITGKADDRWLPKKKEVHTTTFKRTTKYRITNALESMRAKIEAIQEGTYIPPELKEIPADKNIVEEVEKEEPAPKSAATENCGSMDDLTGLGFDDDDFLPAGMI